MQATVARREHTCGNAAVAHADSRFSSTQAHCRIPSCLQTMAALGYNPLIIIALRGKAADCRNQDTKQPAEPPGEQ